uniref:Hairy and enhancer of split-related protein helt n=1 Tax=Cacopsylla melanoneura TaxID=428564 RepID=A0A8D8ZUU5_9HEMI
MVTQNMNYLEPHLSLPSKPPLITDHTQDHLQSQTLILNQAHLLPEKKILNREDPMSHRIIEKRRRDRMNNCLADLSRLIPADYLKKGRGRIEKTEIIEMAIKHMKYLHSIVCSRTSTNPNELPPDHLLDNYDQDIKMNGKEESSTEHNNHCKPTDPASTSVLEQESPSKPSEIDTSSSSSSSTSVPINSEHFKLGYQECLSESMHYLVEVKGYYPGSSLCMQLICHLQKHCDKILRGDRLNKPRTEDSNPTSNSPNSNTSSKPYGPGSSSGDSCERLPKQEPNELSYEPNNAHEQATYQLPLPLTSPNFKEHLTRPNLSLFNIEQENNAADHHERMMMVQHPHESYPTNTSPCPSTSADQSLYKFKNNIKQRFTAEHSLHRAHQSDSSSGYNSASGPPPTKKSRSNESTTKYDDSNDSQCCESRNSNDYPPRRYDGRNHSVAIFALHGDGTFYIPLTVDYASLVPYLGAYSLLRSSRSPPIALHPVTLSVCFQQNASGYTRHTSHTVSGTSSSDFGRVSLVRVSK